MPRPCKSSTLEKGQGARSCICSKLDKWQVTRSYQIVHDGQVSGCNILSSIMVYAITHERHIMRNTSGHYDTPLRIIEGNLSGRQTRKRETKTNIGRRSKRFNGLDRNDTIRQREQL